MRTDWYRRHHDDEVIDRVSIDCVPRFKVSGLSGDEWRVSYVLRADASRGSTRNGMNPRLPPSSDRRG